MPQYQLDESEETMSTDEKPGCNEREYFIRRDAKLIRERVEGRGPGFIHTLIGLIRR